MIRRACLDPLRAQTNSTLFLGLAVTGMTCSAVYFLYTNSCRKSTRREKVPPHQRSCRSPGGTPDQPARIPCLKSRDSCPSGLNLLIQEHVVGKANGLINSCFTYGKYKYRCQKDKVTKKIFLIQKCAELVKSETMPHEHRYVPPISAIFPFSVLSKLGNCRNQGYSSQSEDSDDGESAEHQQKQGKITASFHFEAQPEMTLSGSDICTFAENTEELDIVRLYRPANADIHARKVWVLGTEFTQAYSDRFQVYQDIVSSSTPVVKYYDSKANCRDEYILRE